MHADDFVGALVRGGGTNLADDTAWTGEQWGDAFEEMEGEWEPDVDDDDRHKALLAAYNSDQGDENEDNVRAAVWLLSDTLVTFTAADLTDCMSRLTETYDSLMDLAQEVSDDRYDGFPVEDIKESSSFWNALISELQEKIELNDGKIYVFLKKGIRP